MFGLVDYSSSSDDQDQDQDQEQENTHSSTINENKTSFQKEEPMKNIVPPNHHTVERIKHYLQLKSQGFNLTDSIRNKKEFGNPHILQKVIDYYHIDEMGSNYPIDLWNPALYKPAEINENPQQQQQQQEILNDGSIPIKLPHLEEEISQLEQQPVTKKARKSRWDQQT